MYDKQEVFKKHIQKKADELTDLCKSLGIVSFMSFAVKDDGKTTDYKNYIYGSASNRIMLADDQIRGHVNVANGFQTVPPGDDTDSDEYMSDLNDGYDGYDGYDDYEDD